MTKIEGHMRRLTNCSGLGQTYRKPTGLSLFYLVSNLEKYDLL